MKHLIIPTVAALMAFLPANAQAQSKQSEESAFIMCSDMAGSQGESQACIDWIKEGTCLATYKTRVKEIEKYISSADMQRYRIEAEKQLTPNCEAMTAVELNMDILEHLTDAADRTSRWERLVEWADKLAPNQNQTVVGDLSRDADFKALIKRPKIRAYVEKCRNEAANALPEVSEQTYHFLGRLDETEPAAMTPEALVVILAYEIDHQQMMTAKDRINRIPFDKLPAGVQKSILSKIHIAAPALFGNAEPGAMTCFPEAALAPSQTLGALELINQAEPGAMILSHVIAQKLAVCDEEGAARSLAQGYAVLFAQADMHKVMETALNYADKSRNDRWIRAIVQHLSSLSDAALAAFKSRYAAKLVMLALITARNDLAGGRAVQVLPMLEGLERLAPPVSRDEVLLELGRAQSMNKKEVLARQTWGMLIDGGSKSPVVEKAYFLTIRSLMRDKKTSDADQLKRQFSEVFPASRWLE